MDLGFDPTRLKEITIHEEPFIFERIQTRQLRGLRKKNTLLERIASEMSGARVSGAPLRTNPVLLVIRDRGNAYVLRRKISAIHWEEAVDQLQTHPRLKALNASLRAEDLCRTAVRAANETIADRLGLKNETVHDQLTTFVSWDLKNNQPKLVIDFDGTFLESVWMA
jgi:hypothetical protein